MNKAFENVTTLIGQLADITVDIGSKGLELFEVSQELKSLLKDNEFVRILYGEDGMKALNDMIKGIEDMKPMYEQMMQVPSLNTKELTLKA